MKKTIILIVVIIVSTYVIWEGSDKSEIRYIEKQIGIDIPKALNMNYVDEHGGFHGDGKTFAKLEFLAEDEEGILKEVEDNANWHELPLRENINLLMYGGMRGDRSYSYNLADNFEIPKIENGYWYFLDRHSESTDSSSDLRIFNRFSFNLTIAMYDVDSNTLYYVEFDT